MEKLKETQQKSKAKQMMRVMFLSCFMITMSGMVAYANSPAWGKNLFDFLQETARWLVLCVMVVFIIKYVVKRMWVQFGGFLLLTGIVMFLIDAPQSLKNIGSTLWNLIFG